MALHQSAEDPSIATLTALLKPNLAALGHSIEDEPEAQPAAIARLYDSLRIHVGTRAWVWARGREGAICTQAAEWIDKLRGGAILLDRIGPDGEVH